MKSWNIW